MANYRAQVLISGGHRLIPDADTLEVASGILASDAGANKALAIDGKGSGAVSIQGGAGTGGVNVGTGASAGAVAISRAGINTAVNGTLGVTEAATFTAVINTNGGIQRSSAGALNIGTDANTTSWTAATNAATTTVTLGNQSATINIGGTSGSAATINIWGNVTVQGTETVVGGQTYTGLLTVTSATGGGAANALGPEELRVQMTEAASGGAPIKNPGAIRWSAQTWTGAASAAQVYGAWGAVISTISGAGVPTEVRYVYRNIDNTTDIAYFRINATDAGSLLLKEDLILNDQANAVTITVTNPAAARTATIPGLAANDTFVFLAETQTLTNKTLTSPTISGPTFSGSLIGTYTIGGTPTLGATLAFSSTSIDLATSGARGGTAFMTTFNAGTSMISPSIGPASGQQHTLPAVTSDTVTLNAATQTLTNKTITAPILSGTVTGTYTLGGTPTLGTVTFAGTPTFSGKHTHTANITLTDDAGAAGTAGLGHGSWTADATVGAEVLTGDAVRMSTTSDTVAITNASTASSSEQTATCIGIWDGADVVFAGTVVANFVTGLTLAVGDKIYLSPGTGIKRGALTNVVPTTAGEWVTFVGYVVTTTGYVGGTAEPGAEGAAWPAGLQARIILALGRAPVGL